MTLDEMISDCLKVAEAQCKVAAEFWDHKQLAEWLRELQELRSLKSDYVIFRAGAKRLLKLAFQDLAEAEHCGLCKHEPDDIATCQRKPINCFVWRYADEAEKLFKED